MKPLRLKLTGFLSYQSTAELDFNGLDLACISGSNGAGKSSILDALTWALFGQARCRDDEALIHTAAKSAEVVLDFEYENSLYRIQRSKTRGKSTLLEFFIRSENAWKALTANSVRDTEATIRDTLRMDFETFTNASFFLQGRADQFTQQNAASRKKILSSVLGLEVWETYRDRAGELRRQSETELATVDAQLEEIDAELAQEAERKTRLADIERRLDELMTIRQVQEDRLASLQRLISSLAEQKRLLEVLKGRAADTGRRLREFERQLEDVHSKQAGLQQQLGRASEVEQAYQGWQKARAELAAYDRAAASFHEIQSRRSGPLSQIAAERSRIESERDSLRAREALVAGEMARLQEIEAALPALEIELAGLRDQAGRRSALEEQRRTASQTWQQVSARHSTYQKDRARLEKEIHAAQTRLEEERRSLSEKEASIRKGGATLEKLEAEFPLVAAQLKDAQEKIDRRAAYEEQSRIFQGRLAELDADHRRLRVEMAEIKDRIERLRSSEGALCPLCGQPLGISEKETLLLSLDTEGHSKGDEFRAKSAEKKDLEEQIRATQTALQGLARAEDDARARTRQHDQLESEIIRLRAGLDEWHQGGLLRLQEVDAALAGGLFAGEERRKLDALDLEAAAQGNDVAALQAAEAALQAVDSELEACAGVEAALRDQQRYRDQVVDERRRLAASTADWQSAGAPRLAELEQTLLSEAFAQEARTALIAIDQEARALGYDPAVHDTARQQEADLRWSEQATGELQAARAALEPLTRQEETLQKQASAEQAQLAAQEEEIAAASAKLAAEEAALPDVDQAERELRAAQTEENRLRVETGMVRQLVAVLDTQRERKTKITQKRSGLAQRIGRLKTLERAFGKDGVPALLIEQVLPEIEEQANQVLDRLSGGRMNVRFETQKTLKTKEEKRETLDIIISDASGSREYEMYSGGEAFRVSFAIRLALSRVLAHRAGARLQTLFIDEGFGSQDAEGKQRLIEAINLVRPEFARILVITHLEELKEAFPARVEVEKTPLGSQIRVVL